MKLISFIQSISSSDDGFLILLLLMWFVSGAIDFTIGTGIPIIRKDGSFSSSKLKIGLMVKFSELALMIFVLIPFGISVGTIGITGVIIFISGLIIGEVYSILGHLRLVDDESHWLQSVEEFLKNVSKK